VNDELERSTCDLILRYYPCIHLEGLKTTMKNLSQDGRSLGLDFNLGPPKCEVGALKTRP
jgi:hypothetical protein